MSQKIAFVVNPASAGGKTGREFHALRPEMLRCFPDARFFTTSHPGHASTLARDLALKNYDRIIGVGGDGTFNEMINGLFIQKKPVNPEITFGTLPMGTGSDLIKTLRIPKNPKEALEVLAQNHRVRSDVGCLNLMSFDNQPIQKYFINLCTFGLGGLTCIKVNSQSKALGGRLSFAKGVIQALMAYKPGHITITGKAGQKMFDGRAFNVAIANGKYCGGGMYMAPQASVDSGQFCLIVFKKTPRWKLLLNMPKIYWGGHLSHPSTSVESLTEFEAIEVQNEDIFLEMDGETPGKLPLQAHCIPASLNINTGPDYTESARQKYLH